MSAGHDHGGDHGDHGHDDAGRGHAGHDHTAGANTRALGLTLGLTLAFLLAEVLGGWWFSSLALLSDAAHMFTDAAALAIALVAAKLGALAADDKRTYGYRRFEVLAAAVNASLLLVAAGWIVFESIRRLMHPEAVAPLGMLGVAVAGLVVNLIGMKILAAGRDESLNMKGAYLEVWADAIGSVGVIAGALLIWATGWLWVDPLVAVGIALWVLPRGWGLLREASHILMQGVPHGTDLARIRAALARIEGVASVHELHCWSVAGDDVSLTAHLVLAGQGHEVVRARAVAVLAEDFGIQHVTLQIEDGACAAPPHP
jgi:cobalt-zinc-cadmium efflux system protein